MINVFKCLWITRLQGQSTDQRHVFGRITILYEITSEELISRHTNIEEDGLQGMGCSVHCYYSGS